MDIKKDFQFHFETWSQVRHMLLYSPQSKPGVETKTKKKRKSGRTQSCVLLNALSGMYLTWENHGSTLERQMFYLHRSSN